MAEADLFTELISLLENAGIEVRIEAFQSPPDSAGGLCRFKGQSLVLLHSGASSAERARALLEVVERIGLIRLGVTGKDLSGSLLSALNRRGKMSWPHKKDAPPLAKTGRAAITPTASGITLAQLTTMGVGGPPLRYREASSEGDVIDAAREARRAGIDLYPLGGGSNIVAADAGVDGFVLRLALSGVDVVREGGDVLVTAAAGELWHDFAAQMTDEGNGGVECLGGIPGSVGATPIQNVGAYGQEVSQTIVRVRALDRTTLKVREFSGTECEFSYRHSTFKGTAQGRYIVLSVTYRLKPGAKPSIRYGELARALHLPPGDESSAALPFLGEVFRTVVGLRREKSMVLDPTDDNHRSCGSFFVNAQVTPEVVERVRAASGHEPPTFPGDGALIKLPSAWLIERAGLEKGIRKGPVGLSSKHTLSIVAHDGARAADIVSFAQFVRDRVREKFGIVLVPEPNFWGFARISDGLPVDSGSTST